MSDFKPGEMALATENETAGKQLRYVRIKWIHEDPNEDPNNPIDLFYEVKEDGWPIRGIEVYADGSMESVDHNLFEAAIPPLKEINAAPEFKAKEISKAEFELVWKKLLEG